MTFHRSFMALAVFAGCLLPSAAVAQETKPTPNKIDRVVSDAWEKRGFKPGWMGIDAQKAEVAFGTDPAGITGPIPAFQANSAIKNLKDLMPAGVPFGLFVDDNRRVTDADLDDLAQLKNLTSLNLRGALVGGNAVGTEDKALTKFAGLKGLGALHLSGPQITEAGVKQLAGLKNLSALTLSGTGVKDAWLKDLSGLTNLTFLNVSFSREVTDEGLAHLRALKKLEILSLAYSSVSDEGLKQLAELKGLTTIDLTSTRVGDAGLKHLAGLKKLSIVIINPVTPGDGPQVTDAGLKHLGELKKLTRLHVGSSKITDKGMEHLAGATSLRELYLFHGSITDAGLKHLAGLHGLTSLRLQSLPVTDAGLKELAGLKQLTYLQLSYLKVTNAGVAELQKALPHCKIDR